VASLTKRLKFSGFKRLFVSFNPNSLFKFSSLLLNKFGTKTSFPFVFVIGIGLIPFAINVFVLV
jgi:hypothetical protein